MKDHSLKNYSYAHVLWDLRALIRPYRGRFWLGTLLRLSADLTYLYTAYALAQAIAFFSTYTPGASLRGFWVPLGLWAVTYAYTTTIRPVAKYLCYQVAEQTNLDSQLKALKHMSFLDIGWHEKENTGNKLKRAQNGGEGIEKLLRIWVDNIVEIAVNMIGMTLIMTLTDIRVGVIMLIFFFTYLSVSIPLSRRASAAAQVVNQYEEDFSGLAFETLNNIRTVKVMNMFPRLFMLLQEQSREIFVAIKHRIFRFRMASAVQSNWANIFRIFAFVAIALGISAGRYDIAFFLVFNFYFTTLRTSVEELAAITEEVIVARYRMARLNDILSEPIRIDNEADKVSFPHEWQTIELHDVSFAYGNHQVLKNVSFTIRRGERIGIVGLSGAGKSTLFKLLLKEYEEYEGEILFDEVPLRLVKKSSYLDHVAVVPQDTELFNFTLRDNIVIAGKDDDRTDARLERALSVAHVTDFIPKLPQGVDTLIGEKGVKLSGGEKQRVGIARAIFKEPDILFLDEATSHLDLESEEKIRDSLHQFFQKVTALVIAHRLSTIQEMDRILLFEGGRLLEEGNFETLYQKRGRFFDLWEKQKL